MRLPKSMMVVWDRPLLYAQYSGGDDKISIHIKSARTHTLLQSLARSQIDIAYHKRSYVSGSRYEHIRGCWQMSINSNADLMVIDDRVKHLEQLLISRLVKRDSEELPIQELPTIRW